MHLGEVEGKSRMLDFSRPRMFSIILREVLSASKANTIDACRLSNLLVQFSEGTLQLSRLSILFCRF